MVEFCQNYRLIDQKMINRLSIFLVRLGRKLAYGFSMTLNTNLVLYWLCIRRIDQYRLSISLSIFIHRLSILSANYRNENKWRPTRTCPSQWKLVFVFSPYQYEILFICFYFSFRLRSRFIVAFWVLTNEFQPKLPKLCPRPVKIDFHRFLNLNWIKFMF